jgi:thiopurine S-methyltransferase
MQHEFWHERWQRGETHFHQAQPNAFLARFWPQLHVPAGAGVLVPLCGRSLDMTWLAAAGHPVHGVELSPIACAAYFDDGGAAPVRSRAGAFDVYARDRVRLLCGDFFALKRDDVAGVAAGFDRAALVALPPHMRRDYAARMADVLPAGAQVLLLTFEYAQHEMQGPPFCVTEAEVEALFGAAFTVAALHRTGGVEPPPPFRARGLTRIAESVLHLVRR